MNWQHHRSMTPTQFKNAIKILGMSEREAGRFSGIQKGRWSLLAIL